MALDEVRFPTGISRGSRGGPGFNTAIIETTGDEERTSRQADPRHEYDARWGVKSRDDMAAVLTFFHARQGALRGFRWKDWSDYTTAANHIAASSYMDQVIGAGDGVTTTFQLAKVYTSGVVSRTRNLTKPVSGTTRVAVNGVEATTGWTVNTTTGIVTFTTAPAVSDVITAGCEFDVPVRFGADADKMLSISLDSFDERSLPSIPVIEIRNPTPVDDEFFFGGATQWGTVSADFSITLLDGRCHAMTPSGGGFTLTLPNYADIAPGGPHFYLWNEHATNSISIKDHLGVGIVTLAALSGAIICLGSDSLGAKKWYAV